MTNNTKLYDLDDKEIHINDFVVFPINANGSPILKFGRVVKLNPQTIVIQIMENTKVINNENNNYKIVLCEPYYGTNYRLRNPDRCFILKPNTIPSKYIKLLE